MILTKYRFGIKTRLMMGRRQVVRHRFLVPTCVGSNPAAPKKSKDFLTRDVSRDCTSAQTGAC